MKRSLVCTSLRRGAAPRSGPRWRTSPHARVAAESAEVVFVASPDLASGQSYYRKLKDAVVAKGRHPDDLKVLPGIRIYLGDTETDAKAAYRAELVQGCPAAADNRLFYDAVAAACAHWAITAYQWYPVDKLMAEDPVWGEATLRQRIILRLGIAAGLAAEHGTLEALGHTFELLGAELRRRWPEAATLDLYPAFQQDGG